jgi:tRNA dimethylallyltransferase
VLHARIERRFDAMLAAGFLDEVHALRALPQLRTHPAPLDLPALRAVGYRQAWEHLDSMLLNGMLLNGALSAGEFRDRAIFATRQLAKRQLTWLRSDPGLQWFDPDADRMRLETALHGFLGS